MITRKYNLINNVTGWIIFAIALVTYWLTLEPTASYWDCGEFIIQADKLEVGHPPGNPIFMLTARFFANFATDAGSISVMVNAMSGLLSALTILLLFWTITHLTRRLIVSDSEKGELSLAKYIVIMGAGAVGALAYTWSDTFWFSAVEGEVYAFSSFCTALVFWLILKWENRADAPHSDRYLILIAYVIGISIAVHLLNLLTIPALVLVFAYRKWKDMNLVKSLVALLISFVIIVLVLFGLVPGFIRMAQQFELLFVNDFGLSFNSGALAYALIAAAVFIWAIYESRRQKSAFLMRLSFLLAVTVSGMLFIGSGWVIGWVLTIALAFWLFSRYSSPLPTRVLNVILWSIGVIFIGYSSYALILIRSSADTPMNQNSPDNVFDLATYLNREQYGETPLLYGETLYSGQQKRLTGSSEAVVGYDENNQAVTASVPVYAPVVNAGKPLYAKGVKGAQPRSESNFLSPSDIADNQKLSEREGDYYVKKDYKPEAVMNPELNMLFPRIYSRQHRSYYKQWVNLDTVPDNLVEINAIDEEGNTVPEYDTYGQPVQNPVTGEITFPQKIGYKPTFSQNLAYFFNYQLVHMYFRYFMWNFAGRQNDINNQNGELDAGNWISGIPFIDNARLGDQSLLPDDLGKNNKGHNTFYMLPLLLGLLGLIWQAFEGKRGIEQFWVVFFLFFMTGVAIVLYLNQPPMQPRERDYAYAGSFYAFAIWIGLGVAALYKLLLRINKLQPTYAAAIAAVVGLVIPAQMVSQTWDDHDRSRRYAARDFAINYLNSLEPNAIVFCNGDNDTFPLWYAQEVEGVRPDVKIINLSYLASDWYANQMRKDSYTKNHVDFTAKPADIAYGAMDVTVLPQETAPVDLLQSLKLLYSRQTFDTLNNYPQLLSSVVTIPVDKEAVVKRGLVLPKDTANIVNEIVIDLGNTTSYQQKGYISLSEILMLDIIATNAAEGWPRPIYWCSTVGQEYHLGLSNYMRGVGMTHQLLPTMQEGLPARTDKAYGVVSRYLWGGADNAKPPYFDETARRMLVSTRTSILDVANELLLESDLLKEGGDMKGATQCWNKALQMARLIQKRLPETTAPNTFYVALNLAEVVGTVGERLGDRKLTSEAATMLLGTIARYSQYVRYNRAVSYAFGNPALTPESQAMPYQLYSLIELYDRFGGNKQKLDSTLGRFGIKREELKKLYEAAYGSGVGSDVSESDLVNELAAAAVVVNNLAKMSPEEYAAQSDDDRYIDSIFYSAYEQYVKYGVTKEALDADPSIGSVDLARSKRISEEYLAKHPQ